MKQYRLKSLLLFMIMSIISTCHSQPDSSIDSQSYELLNNHANDLLLMKQYNEAITLYQKAIALAPTNAEIFFNLGQAFYGTKKYPEALEAYKTAIQYKKDHYHAYTQIAQLMITVKQPLDAITSLKIALRLNKNNPTARLLLVKAYKDTLNFDKAIDVINEGLALAPDSVDLMFALGDIHQENRRFTDAITCYETIIHLEPENVAALFKIGCCYSILSDKDKAIDLFNQIIKRNPHSIEALYNKAFVYKTFGDLDAAIEIYHSILTINPDFKLAHNGLSIAYVSQGNFELSWKHHELCFANAPRNGDTLRSLLSHNEVADKTILLHSLGGLGDTFQFIRYAERLKNMGAHVIVNCQKSLIPLLSYCPYIDRIMGNEKSFPDYDTDISLMLLPSIFADNEDTVPKNIPYLFADQKLIAHWQQQLATDTNFKVGICWQSTADKDKPLVAHRGCPLKHFTHLGKLKDVSFYSLQHINGLEQLTTLSPDFPLHIFDNLDKESGPFMDTAALIKNLDLIITVDTSIAHLAGGLGANVWMLHPYATPDWRWIINRTDSYWYPNLRIFKQQKPFDWDDVMESVYAELQQLIAQEQTKGDTL